MLDKVKSIMEERDDKDKFFEVIGRYWPETSADYTFVQNAYDKAETAFEDMYRDDGETLYFEHVRCVALFLVIHLRIRDINAIVAALLHDIVEDIDEWTYERLVIEFNKEVAEYVWWLSKPPLSKFSGDKEARNRAYHQNLARAPRIAIIIKLCDRLHNMLTMWSVTDDKRLRKIVETQDFYLPIAEQEIILVHELEAAINVVREIST